MIYRQTLLALIITVSFAASSSSTKAHNSTNSPCKQSCPNGKSAKPVPYPFGFSGGCNIQLNCSDNGSINIQGFEVQNITATSIFLNISATCNRRVESIEHLFGRSYGLTRRNGLLLRNCSSPSRVDGCSIPTSFLETRFKRCANTRNNDTTKCFSPEALGKGEVFDYTELKNTSCGFLYSSIAVDPKSNGASISLEFQKLELAWWLDDHHKCHQNATRENVSFPGGSGIRCHCHDGFRGDGFEDGLGCERGESTRYF